MARGIDRLYQHQSVAYEAIQKGEDVVLATPTASGKSLCYQLPVLQEIAADPADARDRVLRFYRIYHSCRYVRDEFVIRLKRRITESERIDLEGRFGMLAKDGVLRTGGPLDGEEEHPDLPRLHFASKRRDFGILRQLIDAINDLDPNPAAETA